MLPASSTPLLQVEEVSVSYTQAGHDIEAVKQATFSVRAGEVVGILGESGSGKTTLALSLARMLPGNARYSAGAITFRGRNLLQLTEKQLGGVRGREMVIIWQEPALALNPVMRAGQQIGEVLRAHGFSSRAQREEIAHEWLREVGFDQPAEIVRAYPHQLSGGQRQRVAIAQALCCRPALVIADEPTSKLDAVLQVEIMALLAKLRDRHQMTCLIISHDPAVFAGLADRMLVMYGGEIVEQGSREQVFRQPLHPYTEALVRLAGAFIVPKQRLKVIAGEPANPTGLSTGCIFQPRCPDRMEVCAQRRPALNPVQDGRQVSCFKYE